MKATNFHLIDSEMLLLFKRSNIGVTKGVTKKSSIYAALRALLLLLLLKSRYIVFLWKFVPCVPKNGTNGTNFKKFHCVFKKKE